MRQVQRYLVVNEVFQRIYGAFAANAELEVEVAAGGNTGAAHIGNQIALLYLFTALLEKLGAVSIIGDLLAEVVKTLIRMCL